MGGKPQSLQGKQRKNLENATNLLEELCQDCKETLCTLLEKVLEIYKSKELLLVCYLKHGIDHKIVDVLIDFMEIFQKEDLNQNKKENLSTVWKVTWESYKNINVRFMNFCAENINFWMKTVGFLEKSIFLKKYLNQNDKNKLYTWKEELCEIHRNMETRRLVLWKQITDLLEKVKIVTEEGLNQNHKGKIRSLWREICEIFKNVEARITDHCERNIDLFSKIKEHLEKVMKIIQVVQVLHRDSQGVGEEEKE